MAYFLCNTVSANFENDTIIVFAYGISILQCGSYLLVALSNPKIALKEDNPITVVTEKNIFRVCKKCGAEVKRRTYHCRDCDICV